MQNGFERIALSPLDHCSSSMSYSLAWPASEIMLSSAKCLGLLALFSIVSFALVSRVASDLDFCGQSELVEERFASSNLRVKRSNSPRSAIGTSPIELDKFKRTAKAAPTAIGRAPPVTSGSRSRRQYDNSNQPQYENFEEPSANLRQSGKFERPPAPGKDLRVSGNENVKNSQPEEQSGGESRPKVIETAVFIDQALDTKFNGVSNGLVELNKLVLTIMNQVQYLFEYSSMQVEIKLKLVLIEHLKESERQLGLPMPKTERGDIDAYLSNFCNWQQNRLSREARLWWDHAILLSGLDLYKATPGKNHSGVLGLAWVGGMCKGNYSCTINEASNLESAFVIAHEIGHSLGIMHDGQKNRCDPNNFIMSERTGAGKVHWSKCSNSYLNESIQRGQLACLDSEQNNQIDSLYDLSKLRAPGQVYTINEQCKLAFGSNYTSFVSQQAPFNAVCRELWCVAGTWAKAAHPALEGSSCGASAGDHERLCREGKCVE